MCNSQVQSQHQKMGIKGGFGAQRSSFHIQMITHPENSPFDTLLECLTSSFPAVPPPIQALICCPVCPHRLQMCVYLFPPANPSFTPALQLLSNKQPSHLRSSYFLTNNCDHVTTCLKSFQNLLSFLHCIDTFYPGKSEIYFVPPSLRKLF